MIIAEEGIGPGIRAVTAQLRSGEVHSRYAAGSHRASWDAATEMTRRIVDFEQAIHQNRVNRQVSVALSAMATRIEEQDREIMFSKR